MTLDNEAYHSASVLIKKYGKDALRQAYTYYDTMLALGDADGVKLCNKIIDAIERLQADTKHVNEREH